MNLKLKTLETVFKFYQKDKTAKQTAAHFQLSISCVRNMIIRYKAYLITRELLSVIEARKTVNAAKTKELKEMIL